MSHVIDQRFVAFAETLRPRIPYCTRGAWTHDLHGRNRFPLNRLFVPLTGNSSWCRTPHADRVWLRPGRAILVPGNHDLEWHFATGDRLVAIHFALEYPTGRDLLIDEQGLRTHLLSADLFASFLAADAAVDTAAGYLRLRALLEQVIASLLPPAVEQRLVLSDNAFASDLARLSAQPLDAQLRVADLARCLGIGPDALAKRFERHLGKGPKQWLDERLLVAVGNALLMHSTSVREIAAQGNFSSEFAFSRWFRRLSGMSPTAWRDHYRLVETSAGD